MSVSFNQIPRDVQLIVFSYLRPEELGRYSRVCKIWWSLANTESLWEALPPPAIAFGKREWEKYLGDVGEEPPLPKEIYKILGSPCPFWEGKRVGETHLLTLIPRTVSGEPLTLNSLNQLVQHPKKGQPTKYSLYSGFAARDYGFKPLPESIWVLLTRDVIPGSRGKSFEAQVQLLTKQSQKAGMPAVPAWKNLSTLLSKIKENFVCMICSSQPIENQKHMLLTAIAAGVKYEVPKLLESATSIFMEYLRTEKRLYSYNPRTFAHCQERVSSFPIWPLGIGGFAASGLSVSMLPSEHGGNGLGGMRKF